MNKLKHELSGQKTICECDNFNLCEEFHFNRRELGYAYNDQDFLVAIM
jgi:hypothetical protein